MKPPTSITTAARKRVRDAAGEIKNSLRKIAQGRPGDAEPDEARLADVVQVRRQVPPAEARVIARESGAEAIWGQTIDFVDVAFLERGTLAARSVCRIITRNGQAIGTGFLISPRLLITNNHVIGSEAAAGGMVAEFDYERDVAGNPRVVTRFELAPKDCFVTNVRDDLDYTVVALGPGLAGPKESAAFGFLPLSGARNKHAIGDMVNIIQHADGRAKEAVVRENQIVSRSKTGTVLHYVADTEPGASGSPVMNVMWSVVALHHWGGPHRDLFDERGVKVPRTVNEGIRASAIVSDLQTRKAALGPAARNLVEEALTLGVENGGPRPANETARPDSPGGVRDGVSVSVASDGTATWRIPLSVSVRLGGPGPAAVGADGRRDARTTSPAAGTAVAGPGVAAVGGEARLKLDEDYANREGYDPGFLQSVTVPLPELSRANKAIAAKNKERKPEDDPHELKYDHFSVVMNGKRRLAFFTATNIDGSRAKDVNRKTGEITDASGDDDDSEAAEAAEEWFSDRRIKEKEQTPVDFFAGQTSFDASGRPITDRRTSDHRNRMFQQGHLTRRQDPLWGPDDDVIRAHADTFHVTNRSPQVGFFNMGTRLRGGEARHPGGTLHWRALEDFVLNNARADRQRVTVFTGPIFDDENDIPWSRGRAEMENFMAPREYWKLVLRVHDGRLHATALIADQSPLIKYVPEMLEVGDEEARRIAFEKVEKYHVSVAELTRRTGLDFGADVEAADTFTGGRGEQRRRVESVRDVTLDRRSNGSRARRPSANGPLAGRKQPVK
jgi:endonuclease G, mitochondrial